MSFPQLDAGVLELSAATVINAPRHVVWEVLMDWESYHEWYDRPHIA